MICVSIGRTRHKMVVAEHRALADRGAELVELRLDWLGRQPNLNRLIDNRPTPVVVTVRRQSDKGRWRFSEDQRMTLLRSAIVAGVEYVDLELDIASNVPRYGKTKRIISYHDFDQTPDNIAEIHRKMCRRDPDIVKLVTMANSPGDSVRLLELVRNSKVPTVGFCMGELGVPSRILCGKYGSPFTYATFSREREMAPGQLAFEEMRDIYRFDSIGSDTEVFGVIGDPIGHSLSPVIHNAAFREAQVDAVYLPLRVPRDELTETLNQFNELGMHGFSVTIPHKEDVLEYADEVDDLTGQIGAANTIHRDPAGVWRATNTDCSAAVATIQLGLSGKSGTSDLAGKKTLILGAGGAARAIAFGLIQQGAAVTVSGRTHKRAVELAKQLGCHHCKWEQRGNDFYDVLVNCTPVGMHPNVDEAPIPGHWLREGMLVFDTVYNPESTLLIKEARLRNCQVATGIEMFIRQAAAQFERFTGLDAPLDIMRGALRKGISAVA